MIFSRHKNLLIRAMIRLKRAYERPAKTDGTRILVERLWPRGLTKEKAMIDLWLKDIAPSPELRKWYGHDIEKWAGFKKRYLKELKENKALLDKLKEEAEKPVTFVYAARDEEHNSAVVLKDLLEGRKTH
jgi:uncharacterized protein YeaO (DUF488 family)